MLDHSAVLVGLGRAGRRSGAAPPEGPSNSELPGASFQSHKTGEKKQLSAAKSKRCVESLLPRDEPPAGPEERAQFIHFRQFTAPQWHGILCWSSSKSNL